MSSFSRSLHHALVASLLTLAGVASQAVGAAAPDATVATRDSVAAPPVRPPSPLGGMRNKISAGDLLSAESILEVYRTTHGDTGVYVNGLGWLARGALLLGEEVKARRYVAAVRGEYARRASEGVTLEQDRNLRTALGAAIEVEAQLLARERGREAAAVFVRGELDRIEAPVAFRSRLQKRVRMLTLEGKPAPELTIEDFIGDRPPLLAALRGRPVVLFLWAEWCGDCRAQAQALAELRRRYASTGLELVAVTRYYTDPPEHPAEKARVDSVWTADYSEVGDIPRVLSTTSMEAYGASSTPTFVFIDRRGIVTRYTPTRLTAEEFEKSVAAILE